MRSLEELTKLAEEGTEEIKKAKGGDGHTVIIKSIMIGVLYQKLSLEVLTDIRDLLKK